MTDEHDEVLRRRREWFQEYMSRLDVGVLKPKSAGVKYDCPCCGYATLEERGGYEGCWLCGWEDDGQDDPHADEVWGGPNYQLSLSEARRNFKAYLNKFAPETNRNILPDSEVEQASKRRAMQAFDLMRQATDEAEIRRLWSAAEQEEAFLYSELVRRLYQWEKEQRKLG